MNFVKSFYNSLTNSYRPNIEFVKICHLKINSNLLSLAIILVIEKKNKYIFISIKSFKFQFNLLHKNIYRKFIINRACKSYIFI